MTEVDAAQEIVARVRQARTSLIVHADDPDGTALALVDALDADLVEGGDQLDALIEMRTGLGEHDGEVLLTTDELARLADRLVDAADLVSDSEDAVRSRVVAATGLVIHSESIRGAAALVADAHEQVEAATETLEGSLRKARERLDLQAAADSEDRALADQVGAAASDAAEEQDPDVDPDEDDGARDHTLRNSLVLLAASLVGGIAVFAAGGGSVGIVVPIIALVWVALVATRSEESNADQDDGSEAASDNLARVTALTSQAYGGAGADAIESEEVSDARAMLSRAERALTLAEHQWHALVGPNEDHRNVEEIVQRTDPQAGSLPVEVVAGSPTVRAATRHLRRLRAQWRVAWWTLDRPVPVADAAIGAVEELRTEGVRAIFVKEPTTPVLAPGPVVVIDSGARVDAAAFEAATSQIPTQSRVVVVVAAGATDDDEAED